MFLFFESTIGIGTLLDFTTNFSVSEARHFNKYKIYFNTMTHKFDVILQQIPESGLALALPFPGRRPDLPELFGCLAFLVPFCFSIQPVKILFFK